MMEPTSEVCSLDTEGEKTTSTAKSDKKGSDTCLRRRREN